MGPARDEKRHFKQLDLAEFVPNDITDVQLNRLLYQVYLVLKSNEHNLPQGHSTLLKLIQERHPNLNIKSCRLFGCNGDDQNVEYEWDQVNQIHVKADVKQENLKNGITCVPDFVEEAYPSTPSDFKASTDSNNNRLIPLPFNILSPLKVSTSIKSDQLLNYCSSENHVFQELQPNEIPYRPRPINTKPKTLHPQVPFMQVNSYEEAQSDAVRDLCLNNSIALVRGFGKALDIDQSAFSTKTILKIAKNDELELREQWFMPTHTNVDSEGSKTWRFHSFKCRSDVGTYAEYQGLSFQAVAADVTRKLLKGDDRGDEDEVARKKRRISKPTDKFGRDKIYFGTNVDFSGSRFERQIKELQKLPSFCRLSDESNFLSHLGYGLRGMNMAQFYMKIPRCRTPAHLENNSFCSVNLNAGPGDCEWFGVSYEYFPMIDKLCKERNIDFLSMSWWPDYDDLIEAGIPVFRFTQKVGDLVWVSGGCVHWVEALGWCNNIAWNVGPSVVFQYKMNLISTEWNRVHQYPSLVPMQHLSWQIAREMTIEDPQLFDLVKGAIIRSLAYCKIVLNYLNTTDLTIWLMEEYKDTFTSHCKTCSCELYNLLFCKKVNAENGEPMYDSYCVICAQEVTEIEVWQSYTIESLSEVLDEFELNGKVKIENEVQKRIKEIKEDNQSIQVQIKLKEIKNEIEDASESSFESSQSSASQISSE